MGWTDTGETREQLLEAAAADGHPISGSQLARFHRAGLLPPPEVRALGRGRGTVSVYPPGTRERLLDVVQIHASERRFRHVAWRLWWLHGGPLPAPAAEMLARQAARLDAQRDELMELLVGEEAGDRIAEDRVDALYAQAQSGRLRGELAMIRGVVGRRDFATVMRVIAEVAAGRFRGFDDPEHRLEGERSRDEVIGAAFAIRGMRSDQGDAEHSVADDLRRLTGAVVSMGSFQQQLGARGEVELDRARAELRAFAALIASIAPVWSRLFGRDVFGVRVLARSLITGEPSAQARMLLFWLLLRYDARVQNGLRELLELGPVAGATAELYDLLIELRAEVPALSGVLTDERLVAAQRDEQEGYRLHADIAAVRRRHAREIDAFFDAHPEASVVVERLERAMGGGGRHGGGPPGA